MYFTGILHFYNNLDYVIFFNIILVIKFTDLFIVFKQLWKLKN